MLFPDYLLWKKTEQAEAKNPERRNLIFKIKAEYSTTLAILNYHKKKKKKTFNEKVHSEFQFGNNRDLCSYNRGGKNPVRGSNFKCERKNCFIWSQ